MSKEFSRLLAIMADLRAKCPWDKKQTLESLSPLTIEEVYELVDAVQENHLENLKEEIADIMLHLVFYTKILNEKDGTTIDDILAKGNEKLIHRHPHIYANSEDLSEKEVKENWEKLKLSEGRKSIYSGVPLSLPSIVKAFRIQDKAAHVGFEWKHIDDVRKKLDEEISELDEAIAAQSIESIENELGDVLFSIVNLSRYLKVDPEMALQRTNKKFIQRFQYIEDNAQKPLSDMSLEEMDSLWNEAKTME